MIDKEKLIVYIIIVSFLIYFQFKSVDYYHGMLVVILSEMAIKFAESKNWMKKG